MNTFQLALEEIINSGVPPNPAMSRIIFDYSNYHAVMVLMSGFLFLMFSFLSFKFWTKFKNQSSTRWTFEKKSYLYFLFISIIMALFMLLLVVANTSNTLNPQNGLSLTYDQSSPNIAADSGELHQTFNNWIESSDSSIPEAIMSEIIKRVTFHTAKAFKCLALLIILMLFTIKTWKKIINRSRTINASLRIMNWNLSDKVSFAIGNASIALSLLLLIMVIANIQGAFAPLTAFLVGFL